MTTGNDVVGDLLRDFYRVFGMPSEGPPRELNVTETIAAPVPETELDILRTVLRDERARRRLNDCRVLLEELATRLTSEELLHELSMISVPDIKEAEQLSNGVFWYAMAADLDARKSGIPVTPIDAQLDLPLSLKVQMTVHGSLVMRLYVALVYMREGTLAELIDTSSKSGGKCSGRVRKLLRSDFVRRIRNALSHGSFAPCVAGIVFRDDGDVVVATPGFLNWLCTWLMCIQLQALVATSRRPHVA